MLLFVTIFGYPSPRRSVTSFLNGPLRINFPNWNGTFVGVSRNFRGGGPWCPVVPLLISHMATPGHQPLSLSVCRSFIPSVSQSVSYWQLPTVRPLQLQERISVYSQPPVQSRRPTPVSVCVVFLSANWSCTTRPCTNKCANQYIISKHLYRALTKKSSKTLKTIWNTQLKL